MIFYVVAFALLLHVCFWGAGLAMVGMPRRWRRFWPALVIPAGYTLQSLVVWAGAYANLPGTDSYALFSEIVPLVLLALGLRRLGWRRGRVDVGRFGLVWLVMAGVLAALVLPLAIASRGLTTVSLGSCDAADYAAGARVFMQFAHSDRNGFIGLTEVVHIMSVDNFYDFWLRLNHFTPSALIALNGSILHCPPDQLTGVLTAVVLASTVPVVFWVARALFGFSGAASLGIAGVYGISPITWYSFAQVSPAPLLAAMAVAVLTWAGVSLWKGRLTWRRGGQFAGVLAVGYALVLGAYNFILLVALVPAIAYAVLRTLATGAWPRLARWLLIILLPLVGTGLVLWARVAGLLERFMLFQTYDFGWRIPVLGPDGWLGLVQGGTLHAWSWGGLRWVLAAIVLGFIGWAVADAVRKRQRRLWLIAAVTLPVLAGYAFLEIRGVELHTNASYDAFKLFTVFYPLLLPAFCCWLTLRWYPRLTQWFAVMAFALFVVGLNLVACVMGVVDLSRAPLRVDGQLRQLRRIEAMPDVHSVNLLIPDMWSRLWANAFLLRKPQYFATHTYEGRLRTPLRGEWDLTAGVLREELPGGMSRDVTAEYHLTDTRAPAFVRVEPGAGWYAGERLPNGEHWRWTNADATLRVENPHPYPVTLHLVLHGRGISPRDVTVAREGGPAPARYVHVGAIVHTVPLPAVRVPPGSSVVVLHSRQPAETPAGDRRALSLCVFDLAIRPTVP